MTGEAPLIPPQGVLARDRIAVELRNAIIHGRLQPGERLVEDRIMAWLEATRGATREAFRQLEHEGLVISYPHRGAVVVGVTEDEVHGVLIPIRLVLEQFGFRTALEVGTTADLAELASYIWVMEQAAAAGDIDGIVQADVEFHEAVLHIAPQFHTIHIWRSIAPRIRAYFYRHSRERDLDSVVAEHRELLDVLHQGDEQLLQETLHRHIVVPRVPPEAELERGEPRSARTPPRRRRESRMTRAATEYRYAKLTWPEIEDAVELGKVCIVPCGAVEQHGPHLPLDVDILCPTEIALGTGREIPGKVLVLPTVAYGYTGHVMDFPGTINNHFEHFMHHVLDVTKSLAYHGFKKIILLNGHGSNWPNLDLVARRTNLETDAECLPLQWTNLLTVDPGSCRAGARAPFRAAARMPASSRRRSTCTSTPTTCARTGSPTARSPTTRRTARSTGSTVRRRACHGAVLDVELQRDRGARRARARDRREGATCLRGVRPPADRVRRLLQGPAEGRPSRPAPHRPDDAHAVGTDSGGPV